MCHRSRQKAIVVLQLQWRMTVELDISLQASLLQGTLRSSEQGMPPIGRLWSSLCPRMLLLHVLPILRMCPLEIHSQWKNNNQVRNQQVQNGSVGLIQKSQTSPNQNTPRVGRNPRLRFVP